MTRPLLRFEFPILNAVAAEHMDDPHILTAIYEELGNRSSRKSRLLREAVNARLSEISRESFKWPSTAVVTVLEAFAKPHFEYKEGMLKFLGYSVGQDGGSESERRAALDFAYNETLPLVQSEEHTREWGRPRTGNRLRKLSHSIAHFYKMAIRRDALGYADMQCACEEWLEDLEYLRRRYYVGRFDFQWPRVAD